MEQLVKWRFPSNNHTQELGINTADLETFRKDPASSFAREICQNSIDAQLDKSKPVRIEFSPFSLLTEKLPDREELLSAAVGAYSNWKGRDKSNSLDQLKTITRRLDTNQSMRLRCLRVSDFNTTGLLGVKDNDTSKPFYMLTRGSGASSKEGTSGGSKGIGKNAAFVVSKIRTVFYSTLTKSGDKGSLGIAKFGSGFMFDGQTKTYDKRTKTMGVGYYGIDDFNNPIQEQTFLDEQFSRKIDEFGTDLFIIEHSLEDNWQHLIVAKVLESFMYAIYQGKLEVNVDGIEISKLTLGERINELKILSTIKPPIKKSIVSQYLVLTAENAYEKVIKLYNSEITIKIKGFTGDEIEYATKKCYFIRYPYMKIQERPITNIPSAAIAIIGDNNLNRLFRKFENPEHTEWQFSRDSDSPEEGKKANRLFRELLEGIKTEVANYLATSDRKEIDFEGASDFLPDEQFGDEIAIDEGKDKPIIGRTRKNRTLEKQGYSEADEENALNPDEGIPEDGGEQVSHPAGHNEESGADAHPGEASSEKGDGDGEIFTKEKLNGLRVHFIALNPLEGKYLIRFRHNEKITHCDMNVNLIDDSGYRIPIKILSVETDDQKVKFSNNKISNFSIQKNIMKDIYITTDQTEYFSGEVSIYAYR